MKKELQSLYKLIYQCLEAGMTATAERLQGKLCEVVQQHNLQNTVTR